MLSYLIPGMMKSKEFLILMRLFLSHKRLFSKKLVRTVDCVGSQKEIVKLSDINPKSVYDYPSIV
jgi:hypothetical protein